MTDFQIKVVFNDFMMQNYTRSVQIYTDGSKDEIGTGAAVVVPCMGYEKRYKMQPENSILAAELYAIKKAIEWVEENQIGEAVILSDSQSSLSLLSNREAETYRGLVHSIQELVRERGADGVG